MVTVSWGKCNKTRATESLCLTVSQNRKLFTQEQSSDSQYVVIYIQVSLGSLTGTFHSGLSCYCIGKTLEMWDCQARNLL